MSKSKRKDVNLLPFIDEAKKFYYRDSQLEKTFGKRHKKERILFMFDMYKELISTNCSVKSIAIKYGVKERTASEIIRRASARTRLYVNLLIHDKSFGEIFNND